MKHSMEKIQPLVIVIMKQHELKKKTIKAIFTFILYFQFQNTKKSRDC